MHRDKLTALALQSKVKDKVVRLFKKHGVDIKALEEIGCIAVLLSNKGRYLNASADLRPEDVKQFQNWCHNPVNKLPYDLYKLTLKDSFFVFNKMRSEKGTEYLLVGLLLEKIDRFRFVSIVAHTDQMLIDLNKELAIT